MSTAKLKIIFDKESDGRFIAEVPSLPGVLAYGATRAEARRKVSAIALRTLADKMEHSVSRSIASQLFVYDDVASR
jgi:predicted RNase H-like HicB family nuclease